MRPDRPIYGEPRDIGASSCICRWKSVGRQGGTMRLAEIGPRCPDHGDQEPFKALNPSACKCLFVPTGVGWKVRMIEVADDCGYHAKTVKLGKKDVAPWMRSVS